MRTRKDIRADISAKEKQSQQLEKEKKELILEDIQFCDEEQWYTEAEETHEVSKRPKKEETFMVGRKHWKEEFKDEDTKQSIWIDRSRVVRINGEWQW